MRTLATLAIAIAVLVVFLITRGSQRSLERPVDDHAVSVPDIEPPASLDTQVVDAPLETATSRVTVPEVATASDDEAAPSVLTCVVIGAVTDENGMPLQNALVQLAAHKAWDESGAGSSIKAFGASEWHSMHGFELRTDASGSFRFEVPVPSAQRVSLYIKPDPYHDSFDVRFGGTRRGTRPQLVEGVRDLGSIEVRTTGAITGRITDTSGMPLEDVQLTIGESRSGTFGRYARTTADGFFFLGHAPVGIYGIGAETEGYLSHFHEPITIESGRSTGPIEFKLELAPTITGRIVDESGKGIEGTELWGWPQSSGAGAGAKSDMDGRFTVTLPQNEPYSLSAKHPDFVTWGEGHDKSILYEPGTTELSITMERVQKTRFVIVDAESSDPIESFGLNVLENNGSMAPRRVHTERRPPSVKTHPGGFLEQGGRVGVDLYVVHATGYLLAMGDIQHDTPEEPIQTIRLVRGSSIIGRLVKDGTPVPSAAVEIVRNAGYPPENFRPDDNTRQRTTTGEDGQFEIVGLAYGPYRLSLLPSSGAPLIRNGLMLHPPKRTDLGDLELIDGGIIEGAVRAPAGIDPSGLKVYLGARSEANTRTTDSAGRFRFEDVAAGKHVLFQSGRPGIIDEGGNTQVSLTSGRTATVDLDLGPLVMVESEITVDLGGLPASGIRVEFVLHDAPKAVILEQRKATSGTLGETDPDGLARGSTRALGPCRVSIWIPGIGMIKHPTAIVDLVHGRSISETIAFDLAGVAVELSPDLPLPVDGSLYFDFQAIGEQYARQGVIIPIESGAIKPNDNGFTKFEDGRLVIEGVAPGNYDLTVYGVRDEASNERIELGNGSVRFGPKREFERTQSVTLTFGERMQLTID